MLDNYAQYKKSIFVKYIENKSFSQVQIRQQLANVEPVDDDNLVLKITLWKEKIWLTNKLGNCIQKYYKGIT